MTVSGLVPARFLTLTAHCIVTIAILWSREENVKACLPLEFSDKDYEQKDTQFIVALSLSLTAIAIEYAGFFGGITTFMSRTSLISICLHSAACIAIAFFVWDVVDCDLYWYIFGFTCAAPAAIETGAIISVLGLRKSAQ